MPLFEKPLGMCPGRFGNMLAGTTPKGGLTVPTDSRDPRLSRAEQANCSDFNQPSPRALVHDPSVDCSRKTVLGRENATRGSAW